MQDFMNHIHMVKIKDELVNSKIAAQFVEWSMKKMIKEVEHVIESDINVKHSKIAGNIEKIIDNSDKIG
jgi:nucleosome binding factor SPN SPT16 subunit